MRRCAECVTRTLFAISLLCALALPSGAPRAATVRVDPGGGGYATIQEGLDAAEDGDTVVIAPGTYSGEGNRALTFSGKDLVIEAESGFSTVTIDCEGADRAFAFQSTGQDTTTVIRDLVIRNASTTNFNGGAIICYAVGLVIENCLFEDCVASHNAGAVYVSYNAQTDGVQIRNCVFRNNIATYRGGALSVDHGRANIHTCLFTGNSTTSSPGDGFGGGAIHLNWIDYTPGNTCNISRCTIVNNSSTASGSGIYAWQSFTWAFISRTIVAFNDGPGLGIDSYPMLDGLTFSIAYGNEGGNIAPGYSTVHEEDPRFCDMAADDYTLCSNSYALPSVNPYTLLMGFADQGCGACNAPVRERSWGAIKALYRD